MAWVLLVRQQGFSDGKNLNLTVLRQAAESGWHHDDHDSDICKPDHCNFTPDHWNFVYNIEQYSVILTNVYSILSIVQQLQY